MHLVTLVENTTMREDLIAQHGLSLYMVCHGKHILFDMGQDDIFFHNAKKLGVDISNIDYAILSHGHYDHCGGLSTFLQHNSRAPIYLGSGSDKPFYSERPKKYRYIGLDDKILEENAERLRWVHESLDVSYGIHLISGFDMDESRPKGNRGLYIKEKSDYLPDPFAHEILCIIEEPDGITLVTGCGHSGIINMVASAKRYLPDVPVKAVIGGFHLIGESRQEIERIAGKLLELGCGRVITGHCTGEDAAHIMEEVLGDRLDRLHTGYSTDL